MTLWIFEAFDSRAVVTGAHMDCPISWWKPKTLRKDDLYIKFSSIKAYS